MRPPSGWGGRREEGLSPPRQIADAACRPPFPTDRSSLGGRQARDPSDLGCSPTPRGSARFPTPPWWGYSYGTYNAARRRNQYILYNFLVYAFCMEACDRLQIARAKAGFESASAAAAAFGWVAATYLSHENGWRGLRVATAERYARAFGVTAVWLLMGDAAISSAAQPAPNDLRPGPIARRAEETDPPVSARAMGAIEIEAAAGGGAVNLDEAPIRGRVWFRRDWLDSHGLDPTQCMVIAVRGESMEPTLPDGCSILVDRQRKRRRDRGIFVIDTEDGLIVKRLGKEGRRWLLISDHEAWPAEPWPPGAQPVGRVIWMARTLV